MSSDVTTPTVGAIFTAPMRVGESLPLVGSLVRGLRHRVSTGIDDVVAQLIRAIVVALADEIDLTSLVIDNVDLGAVVATVDLNEVITHVDLDAAIGRVDLMRVINSIDLDAAVARVDLMAVVRRLDVDAVVAQVDLDAAVARVDLDAAIRRADLIGVANDVIDGVDLTAIIREASTSVTADVMTDVRSGGERADDAVSEFVGRILRRPRSVEDDD
ncbi:hypothetical protein [Gordonia sp. CPCC 205333]|uniref:hypothetical protein n=1 Tax=Gordonia sp. CPCC 205333 TaxID=3140790 RepID=UPI003AF3FC3D